MRKRESEKEEKGGNEKREWKRGLEKERKGKIENQR